MKTKSKRALLLIVLTLSGIAIGAVGKSITGDDAWFLATPILLAIGWLAVADPERCMGQCKDISKPDDE